LRCRSITTLRRRSLHWFGRQKLCRTDILCGKIESENEPSSWGNICQCFQCKQIMSLSFLNLKMVLENNASTSCYMHMYTRKARGTTYLLYTGQL